MEENKTSPAEKLEGMYKTLFTGPIGKFVLHDMMVDAGYFTNNYVAGDSHGTSFNEGRRASVVRIINLLKKGENQEFLQELADAQEQYNSELSSL